MSIEENKALVGRFFEAVNTGDLDTLDQYVAADFVEHEGFPGLPTTGPEAPKAALGLFRTAFPNLNMTADEILADGDKVVVRGTMSGTHRGEFMGIPPTSNSFKVQFIDIIEIRDGKATAHWGITDQAAMMQQLGLVEM
jgi:steroid delta-isomerase-like uncharacterized protein